MTAKSKEKEIIIKNRPPIVTVMGHVDHGKTTLVDFIRKTHIAEKEFGGITQHVRAFQVNWQGKPITFIDTPGHEAFSAMRARGSKITDIILLVVAADDGVMPQTKEVINLALSSKIPLIVAINKIDLPGANVQRVKSELSQNGVMLEGWGGDVVSVEVSATLGTNVEGLMEMILLTSEIMDLKDNPEGGNFATVLESLTDKSKGQVTVAIVQNGILHQGDFIATAKEVTKIRSLIDSDGNILKEASSSTPISILGLGKEPEVGEVIYSSENRKLLEEKFKELVKPIEETQTTQLDVLSMLLSEQEKTIPTLSLIIKADVAGSLQAINESLANFKSEKVKINIIKSQTGDINESDIAYAKSTKAVVIGFNVGYPKYVEDIARTEKVIVMKYKIIYELIDEVTQAAQSLIPQAYQLVSIGEADARQSFTLSNGTHVAGCLVTTGKMIKNNQASVERRGQKVFEGKILNIRHLKDEVKEGVSGTEYGIALSTNFECEEGDKIICYRVEKL